MTPQAVPPLRVLQVAARYLPDLGGIETHVHEVGRRLAAVPGIEVTVLASDLSGERPADEVVDGMRVLRRRAYPASRDWYAMPGLVPVLRSGEYDLVHVQGVHTLVPPLAMAAARTAGVPYVVTFHTGGHSSSVRTAARGTQWRVLAPLLRQADRLIGVSRSEARTFAEVTGVDPARIEVVRNGGSLPPVPDGVAPVPGRIVSSGRLERYKGHHRVIEALPLVRRERPDAHLVVLGAGPYEPELRALAEQLGVSGSVEIRQVPPTDRALMSRELAQAEVFAALSDYEAHPVAVVEALTLGLPVVGTDVAGVADLVEDGLVRPVPLGAGADVTAEALLSVLRAPADAVAPAAPASWDESAATLARIYGEVLRDRAGRTSGKRGQRAGDVTV